MTKTLNIFRGIGLSLFLLCTIAHAEETTSTFTPPPPEITCPENLTQLTSIKPVQRIMGMLDATDPVFSSPFCLGNNTMGDYEYDWISFTPSITGRYTFFLGADFAATLILTEKAFNPQIPCDHLLGTIGWNNNLPLPSPLVSSDQSLSFVLQAGQTYNLVVTAEDIGTFGNWEIIAYNVEGGNLDAFDAPFDHLIAFDFLWPDLKSIIFTHPQQWIVNPEGQLDTAATLSTVFANDQVAFNRFLSKVSYTGLPVATADCPLLFTLSDESASNGGCSDIIVMRSFQVEPLDNSCNTPIMASCQQTITFRRPGPSDIQWPPYTLDIPCDENFPTDGSVGGPDENPSQERIQRPALLSAFGYRDLPTSLFNLSSSYQDDPRVIVCDGIYKIRRKWRINDWCSLLGNNTFDQIITVGDEVGPVFDTYPDTIIYSTSPFDCNAYIQIYAPEVLGDANGCSDAALSDFLLQYEGLFIASGSYPQPAPITLTLNGDYFLTSCAEDDCGNESCIEIVVLVRDEILPTLECPEQLNIPIGGGDVFNGIEGIGFLEALDFFEDADDNCGSISLEIRRNYWRNNTCDPSPDRWTPWGENIFFYCCDFGVDVTVELRVTDDSGNQRICSTIVTTEDQLSPYCYNPEDIDIHLISLPAEYPLDIAGAYETNFEATSLLMNDLFGAALGTDNCAVDTIVELSPQFQLNECGEGIINRRFQAWQAMIDADLSDGLQIDEVYESSNTCVQIITLLPNHAFQIAFPADAVADCTNPDIVGVEIISAGDCDLFSINTSEPVIYPGTNEACYEMAVTYDIINWLVWDGISDAYEIERITEEDGELWAAGYTVEPAERPMLTLSISTGPDDENCNGILDFLEGTLPNQNDLRCSLVIDRSHPEAAGDSNIPDFTYDNIVETPADCIPTQNYGRYSYTQLLTVTNEGIPTLVVDEIGGPTEECPNLTLGQFGDYTGSCDAVVAITFRPNYNCSAFDSLATLTPLGTMTAELFTFALDENHNGEIEPAEFTSSEDVSEMLTLNDNGSYTYIDELPIITPDMGNNVFHALRIHFIDDCENETTDIITFDVVDCKGPAPICINGLTINLMPLIPLEDINGDGELDTHIGTISASMFEGSPISDCTGQGPELFFGKPRVSSYAIYLAQEVDANPNFIPSPADSVLLITQDGEETTVVYIYAFDEEGNSNYCETYVLVQLQDCSSLQLECRYLRGNISTEGNNGIRDVNIDINNLGYRISDFNGYYYFGELPTDQPYTITPSLNTDHSNGISTNDLNRLSDHLQGTAILTSPYQLIAADVNNSGTVDFNDLQQLQQLLDGTFSTFPNNSSWRFVHKAYVFPDPANPWIEVFPESIYFSELTEDVTAADFIGIKIGDLDGSAEGISPDGTAMSRLTTMSNISSQSSSQGTIANELKVYQNTPNPFQEATQMGFELSQNEKVKLSINDLTGRQVFQLEMDGVAGYNMLPITPDMLNNNSGVLMYTLSTATQSVTKKMIALW